jgi:hypothetical protein
LNRELYVQGAKTDTTKLASSTPVADQTGVQSSWYAKLKDRVHRFLR